MGDLSEHFSRHEFACHSGSGFDTVDVGTLALLERIRAHFGRPVRVTSGCRSPAYNRKVGGAPNSQHVLGRAADIQIDGVSPDAVADFAESVLAGTGGLGRYRTFTHVDTRSDGPARWDNR